MTVDVEEEITINYKGTSPMPQGNTSTYSLVRFAVEIITLIRCATC